MPILTLTVARIDPPRPNGGKNGKIVGTGGETIYAPPSKTAKFIPGHTYEIDYSTSDWNGKSYNNLESFHEVEGAKPSASPSPANGSGGSYRPTSPQDAERMWTCAIVTALIKAGEVKNDKQQLWAATQMARGVWKHTFAFDSVHQHLEAAE